MGKDWGVVGRDDGVMTGWSANWLGPLHTFTIEIHWSTYNRDTLVKYNRNTLPTSTVLSRYETKISDKESIGTDVYIGQAVDWTGKCPAN